MNLSRTAPSTTSGSIRRLTLAPGLRDALATAAREVHPDEACGLLLGVRDDATGTFEEVEVTP